MDDNISMQQLNLQIHQLQEQSAAFENLRGELGSLEKKRIMLEQQVYATKREKDERQSELNQMQTGGLNTFLSKIIPGREKKLEVCRMMADEAAAKYDTAIHALMENTDQIHKLERQVSNGHQARLKLDSLIAQKAALIQQTGGDLAQTLADLDNRLYTLSQRRTELDQAVQAGRGALATIDSIIDKLQNAQNWGTFDIVGGGLITDIAKHSNLDDASQLTYTLQKQIHAFQKELSDISIHADFSIEVSDFMKFADFAFDGLIADWLVLDKINSSLSQATHTRNQIASAIHMLEPLQQECVSDHDQTRRQRINFLIEAS